MCGLAAPEGISLLIAFRRHVGPPVVRTRDIHIIRISVIFVLGRTSQTTASLRLKFHANSVLVASWLHPCEDVRNTACVSGSWNFGERHDTRTNGQHYTAADRRPTNRVSAWQTERGSRTTRRHPREHPHDDVGVSDMSAWMPRGSSRGNCFRGI